jgi:hypothetical protein
LSVKASVPPRLTVAVRRVTHFVPWRRWSSSLLPTGRPVVRPVNTTVWPDLTLVLLVLMAIAAARAGLWLGDADGFADMDGIALMVGDGVGVGAAEAVATADVSSAAESAPAASARAERVGSEVFTCVSPVQRQIPH